MTRRRRTAAIVAALAVLQGAAVLAWWRRGDDVGSASARAPVYERARGDEVAPELVGASAHGEVRLSSKRGRPVLLHFWATWCPPCVTELPELLALSRTGAVDVVAVSVDESDAVLDHYFAGAVPGEVVRVDHEVARRLYGAAVLPLTVLVDRDGVVRGRFQGAQTWRTPAMAELLRAEVSR